MQKFHIYKNLEQLNKLPKDKAEATFRDCCGSSEWARLMAQARPFAMIDDLYKKAETIWFSLSSVDHLEALASHPKIGSRKASPTQQAKAAKWSSDEQSGMRSVGDKVKKALAEANRLYLEKFGFIFIVCATGKSAEEMLAICRARLGNSAATELQIAAEEQRKITEIRLNKLLEK